MAEAASGVFLKPEDRLFPLKEGEELYIHPLSELTPKNEPKFAFDVAFGQGEIVEGEPILEALNELVGITEQVIELFAPLL
jgi:hypothetical protein